MARHVVDDGYGSVCGRSVVVLVVESQFDLQIETLNHTEAHMEKFVEQEEK